MKYIVAIIRPERFEAVLAALFEQDIHLLTVSDVRGCGAQKAETEQFRGNTIGMMRLLPKVKLEIAVNEAYVRPTVDAIVDAARSGSGHVGDGKIFVLPLDEVYRVRTAEVGTVAIGP